MSEKLDRVRVALIGCGAMMGRHAQRLREHPDAEIVALCDVSGEQLSQFEAKHLPGMSSKIARYSDPSDMYTNLEPDAVFIGTPHTQHFRQGVEALRNGCHVFMEKPMVTSLEDAYALEREVANSGKILVVGYNTPCSPEFQYLRETIHNGSLGRLEMVTGFLSQNWLRATSGKWRQEPELSGGGQAYDSGAHLFNSLCWSVNRDVEEVFAYVDNHGTQVDINSVSSIRFADGLMANITVSGNSPGSGRFMAFIFDGGRIEIDGWEGNWIRVWQGSQPVKYPSIADRMGSPSPDHNFIEAVLGRTEPRTTARHGVIQSQLMEAFYESQRTGRPARPPRA